MILPTADIMHIATFYPNYFQVADNTYSVLSVIEVQSDGYLGEDDIVRFGDKHGGWFAAMKY